MSSPAPGTQPEFDCRATAAMLRALQPLIWASQIAALIAAGSRHGWVSMLCWGPVLYFAVRVQLDAGLFELLAENPGLAQERLDTWLARAGLRKRGSHRSLEDRCRGAHRLARNFAAAWLAQMATLAWAVAGGKG